MSPELDRLSGALANCVSNAHHWPEVCNQVAAVFDAIGAIIIPVDPAYRGIWMPQSETLVELTDAYLAGGWAKKDYRQMGEALLKRRKWFTDDDLGNRKVIQQDPYYLELMIPHGVGFAIIIEIPTINGPFALSIQFEHDRKPVSEVEGDLALSIRQLVSETAEAAILQSRQRIKDLTEMMSETTQHVFTLDCLGNVLRTTADSNVNSIDDWQLNDALFLQLREICASDPADNISEVIEIEKRRFNIFQIPKSVRHFCIPDKVLVVETKTNPRVNCRSNVMMQKFDLTPAEITCLEILSRGNSINDTADLLSLKVTTVRQRLKNIYQKVEVNSQAQLVAKYLRI